MSQRLLRLEGGRVLARALAALAAAAVGRARVAADEAALLHPSQVMREPAAFPADHRGELGRAHPVAVRLAQREQDPVVTLRQGRLGLQATVESQAECLDRLDEVAPGPQFRARQGAPRPLCPGHPAPPVIDTSTIWMHN